MTLRSSRFLVVVRASVAGAPGTTAPSADAATGADPRTLQSIAAQSFTDFTVHVVDTTEAVNAVVATSSAQFVVLVDGVDELLPSALACIARVIDERPDTDFAYADEDIPAETGAGERITVRKPDWSPERLRHGDYIGAFRAIRAELLRVVGGYDPAAGTAQDYDLTLRVTEQARHVAHLAEVLCHRGSHPSAPSISALDEAAAQQAAQRQLDRCGIAGTVGPGPLSGYHRLRRTLDPELAVSIIVPTRGQLGEVNGVERYFVVDAVRTALAKTMHRNLEVVVVHDETTPAEVLDRLREVAKEQLVLLPYAAPFNFSEKCNLGFVHARGDVVVLLNDDTEAISDNWLEALVAPLAEPDVGMTGAKLRYADGTIQHAGHVYVSRFGLPYPRHAYRWSSEMAADYGSLAVSREVSGVTAACAALRREVYEAVGGLCEMLPRSFNDVDLSLKVRHAGLRILWMADCELYHYESQSRDPLVQPFESAFLIRRWPRSFDADPYLPWYDKP